MSSDDDGSARAPAAAPGQLVTVATYGSALEAQIARSTLAAHGVRAFIADEHLSTLNPHYVGAAMGIRLQVRHADLERAAEVLRSEPEPAPPDDDEHDEAAQADGPKCPRCEARYAYREWSFGELAAIVLLLGLPLLVFEKRWHCHKCGTYWRAAPPLSPPGGPYRAPKASALRGK